jgi:hypothetical protein
MVDKCPRYDIKKVGTCGIEGSVKVSFGFKVLRWGCYRREEEKNASESSEVSNNMQCGC